MKILKLISLLLIIVAASTTSFAQFGEDEDPSNLQVPSDSLAGPIQRGTLETFKNVFEGKPGRAALYGLLIPGGGQFYNRRYWKAPIVLAADGVAIYYYITYRQIYKGFQSNYEAFLRGEIESYLGYDTANGLRLVRNETQLLTERAGIAIVVIHLLSVIEAFTDRHLMNFDIDENLSFDVRSLQVPQYHQPDLVLTGAQLTYRF